LLKEFHVDVNNIEFFLEKLVLMKGGQWFCRYLGIYNRF